MLCNHGKLNLFKNEIITYVEKEKFKDGKLCISFDNTRYSLLKDTKKIAKNFLSYIQRKINSSDKYVRYMDLKALVQSHQRQFKKNYVSTLHTQVKINDIFSKSEGDRLRIKIEAVKSVEVINGSIDYIGNEI